MSGFLPAASTIQPEEREFVVGSGASMHNVSRKDLNSAELGTARASKSPTTVVTVNGEVLIREEATVYVRELDLFVTVMLLEDTPTTEHPASTISESMSEEVRGNTEHGHSFLTYPESFLQRAQTLRRSTATAEWRSGWAPTLYRVWTQTACWEQGLQEFHRREAAHWTRRFTCQTLVLPPIDHSVDLRFSGKLRDTAPESDLDDEQLRALLASPLYLQEREASAERSQVHHSERENLMSSSSQDPISTGKPVALFSSQNRLNQETFSDRMDFSLKTSTGFWEATNLSSDSLTRLKRDLNSWSRSAKWYLLTLALVSFSNKVVLSGWNWRMPI